MYIIAGLGNPGLKYAHTRHNAGFESLERLADRYRIDLETRKFRAYCGTGVIEGQKALLLKPQTYMNLSGESIRAACDFYKIDPESELIVLYDDVSLEPGQLRVRLGTQVFLRVKIGVGEKPPGYDLADYVLGHFSREEWPQMEEAFGRAAQAAAGLLSGETERVMNEFNTRIHREKECDS